LSSFEISYDNALFTLGACFFLLYAIKPSLILKIFKINPDEDVIEEMKKDLKLSIASRLYEKDK
jgi:hypothetical protein